MQDACDHSASARLPPAAGTLRLSCGKRAGAKTFLPGFTCKMRTICINHAWQKAGSTGVEACDARWHEDATRNVLASVLMGLARLCMPRGTETDQEMGTGKKWQMHDCCWRTTRSRDTGALPSRYLAPADDSATQRTPQPEAAGPARCAKSAITGAKVQSPYLPQIPSTSSRWASSIWQGFPRQGLSLEGTRAMPRFQLGNDRQGIPPSMQAVLALRRASGIATGLAKGFLLFALRRARTVQRTVFSSSTVSTQLALLAINFCFLYAGAPLAQRHLAAHMRQTVSHHAALLCQRD